MMFKDFPPRFEDIKFYEEMENHVDQLCCCCCEKVIDEGDYILNTEAGYRLKSCAVHELEDKFDELLEELEADAEPFTYEVDYEQYI